MAAMADSGRALFAPSCLVQNSAAHIPELPLRPLPSRAAPAAGGEIAVQFLTSPADFAKLAPEWNRLHEQAAAASVFNSWIWQYQWWQIDRKSTRLNSSHVSISYAVFCLKKKRVKRCYEVTVVTSFAHYTSGFKVAS